MRQSSDSQYGFPDDSSPGRNSQQNNKHYDAAHPESEAHYDIGDGQSHAKKHKGSAEPHYDVGSNPYDAPDRTRPEATYAQADLQEPQYDTGDARPASFRATKRNDARNGGPEYATASQSNYDATYDVADKRATNPKNARPGPEV